MSSGHSLCDGISEAYSIPFHTGAIFVILFASIFGTVLPIVTLYVPFLRKNPFIFVIAKTAATGVLLSVSTIHLLGDGLEAFNEYCVPQSFKDVYPQYGLFFTVFAALIMHFIDYKMVSIG